MFLREQGDLAQDLGPITKEYFIQEFLFGLSIIIGILTTWRLLKHDISFLKRFAIVKTRHKRSLTLTYFLKGAASDPLFFCPFIGSAFIIDIILNGMKY